MTPREWADKIFKLFLREPYDGYFNDKPDDQIKLEIESLLAEALNQAKAAAYEEAAKIAEFKFPESKYDLHHPSDIASKRACEEVAEMIRQRLKE